MTLVLQSGIRRDHGVIDPQGTTFGYSVRRYFVDEFHVRRIREIPAESLVLDLGGNRIAKRGQFDIERYALRVIYANLSTAKQPHTQADAAAIPFVAQAFDAVIFAELLEHVPDPAPVLREIARVLRPGSVLLLCGPFLFLRHDGAGDKHG